MLGPITNDLEVASEALRQGNLSLVNIIGNRIATDSIILGEYNIVIVGFLVKEISGDCMTCKSWGQENFENSIEFGLKFIERIKSIINNEFDAELIWKEYIKFEEQIFKYILIDIERDIYKKDLDFVKETRVLLMKLLDSYKNYLFNRNNNLIRGIASEMSRVLNEYGFPPKELAFYLLMKVLGQYYNYFVLDYSSSDDASKTAKRQSLESDIRSIEALFEEENPNFFKDLNQIICKLGKEWRELYIIYGDMAPIIEEKRLELPVEAKKEIQDIIIQGLKAEVEKE